MADQNLLTPAADLAERRKAFLREIRGILTDMTHVEQIARDRFFAEERRRHRESAGLA